MDVQLRLPGSVHARMEQLRVHPRDPREHAGALFSSLLRSLVEMARGLATNTSWPSSAKKRLIQGLWDPTRMARA